MTYEVQSCQYINFIYKSDVEINHKDRLHKQMAGLSDSHQLERLALKPALCFIGESCCWALLGKGYFSSSTKTSCAQKCLFPLFLEDKTNYSQQLLHNFLLESCGVRGHSSAVMDGSRAYGVHMLIVLCLWSSLSKCQGRRAAAGKMLKSFSSVYCASGRRFIAVSKT